MLAPQLRLHSLLSKVKGQTYFLLFWFWIADLVGEASFVLLCSVKIATSDLIAVV